MLEWKEEYEIGVEEIDQQHKRLFEIGNTVYNLLENYLYEDKYDKIVAIINELQDYTRFHFNSEEQYMIKIRYPKYFSQKTEHDDFISKLEEVQLQDIDNNQDDYIRELLVFIFDWILDHIMKKDRLIGNHEV